MIKPDHPVRGRRRFSLDQAARIRRTLLTQEAGVNCPQCGAALRPIAGTDGTRRVWLLPCDSCGGSVVVDDRPPRSRET